MITRVKQGKSVTTSVGGDDTMDGWTQDTSVLGSRNAANRSEKF